MLSIKCLVVSFTILFIVQNVLGLKVPILGKIDLESAKSKIIREVNKVLPIGNPILSNVAQKNRQQILLVENVPGQREAALEVNQKVVGDSYHKQATVTEFSTILAENRVCPRLQVLGDKLLTDQTFCDIEIEVIDSRTKDKKLFCAHRSILALRSTVLWEMITKLVERYQGRSEKPRLIIVGPNPDVFKYILQYIYTDKIDRDFDAKRNILDLLVASEYSGLTELVIMIKEYLAVSIKPGDIGFYLEWANSRGKREVMTFLLEISRSVMHMKDHTWRLFMKNICEAYKIELGEEHKVQIQSGTKPIKDKPIDEELIEEGIPQERINRKI